MQIKKTCLLEERQNFMNNTLIITIFDQHGSILIGSPQVFSRDLELMRDMEKTHFDRIHYLAERERDCASASVKTHNTC